MKDRFDLDSIGGDAVWRALVDEVRAAGDEALAFYDRGVEDRVEFKADASPVTDADRRVEQRLRAFITARCPGVDFCGEETGRSGSGAHLCFWVDPIDGTRAFVRGIPTWSVLVGLAHDDVPVAGIAFMPAAADMFVGARGHGATCNGRNLTVSTVDSLERAAISHGSLVQFVAGHCEPILARMARRTYTQRGFADFDGYRQLLLGRVDAMIDPAVLPWDLCAAAALVAEAGGRLTDLRGAPTIHGGGGLATNGRIHDALVREIATCL